MIEAEKRKAIFLLHQEGMDLREITRHLGVSRNTVRAIVGQEGTISSTGSRRLPIPIRKPPGGTTRRAASWTTTWIAPTE